MEEDDTRGRKRKRHPYHFSSHFAQLVVRVKREAEKRKKRGKEGERKIQWRLYSKALYLKVQSNPGIAHPLLT